MPTNGLIVPELIQNVDLVAAAADNYFTYNPAQLPNGEGSLVFEAGRAGMRQPAVSGVHIGTPGTSGITGQIFTLNFWLKVPNATVGTLQQASTAAILMGVIGDNCGSFGLGNCADAGNSNPAAGWQWALSIQANTGRLVYTQAEWGDDKICSWVLDIPDTNWHMYTLINPGGPSGAPAFAIHRDGNSVASGIKIFNQGGASSLRSNVGLITDQYFSIGVPGYHVSQNSVYAGVELAKVSIFWDQALTNQNMVDLYTAMTA